MEKVLEDPDRVVISGRWINCNKQDAAQPKCRGRCVGQEVNARGEADPAFYAATPPLEAKRILFSRYASERTRGGKPLKLHVLDVRTAYFNGVPTRSIYVKLPFEMGLGKNVLGKLRKCIYGTRDAGAIWEATFTQVLLDLGFVQGVASPCCFHHAQWGVSLVVHGDDFTALGTGDALNTYEQGMLKAFDCDVRGRLGPEAQDAKEIKILNRFLRVVPEGLRYEADPRHVELLATALGLEACREVSTPGAKGCPEEQNADGQPHHEDEAKDQVRQLISSLKVKPSKPKVKFSPQIEVVEVDMPYSLQ